MTCFSPIVPWIPSIGSDAGVIANVANGGQVGVGTIGRILGTVGAILGTVGEVRGPGRWGQACTQACVLTRAERPSESVKLL